MEGRETFLEGSVAGALMPQRVMQVFVSLTFRDMHAEREELIKRVFPELRKRCEARGVTWTEVDLRWGITDEQQAEGKVCPSAWPKIRHCRPFFIGPSLGSGTAGCPTTSRRNHPRRACTTITYYLGQYSRPQLRPGQAPC